MIEFYCVLSVCFDLKKSKNAFESLNAERPIFLAGNVVRLCEGLVIAIGQPVTKVQQRIKSKINNSIA